MVNITPKLKFSGFEEKLTCYLFENITNKIGDGIHSTPKYSDCGDVFFINGNNLVNGKITIFCNTKKISVDEFTRYKNHLAGKSILLSINGTIGSVAYYKNEPVLLGKSIAFLNVADGFSSEWVYYSLQSTRVLRFFEKEITGSTIKNLSLKTIRETVVYVPSIEEQNKVGNFLSLVDEKIVLQTRKVELLEQYKKGMMQKLFSQKIRFKDDNGCSFSKWKKTTLSCVASITMGTSPGSSYYNTNQHGLPLIQGNADIKNRYSKPRVYTRQITKECHYNDILLSVRAPVGEVARSKHHACIGRGVAALKASGSNDQEFLYQLLLSIENKWDRISQGSTFESINTNDIKTLPIEVPSLLEQKKIADSLSLIDDKIILENAKLDKLKQWKQGLLQQMFV